MVRFCIILFFLSQKAVSQQINPAVTAAYVQVPGTKFFIIPPDTTFTFSKNFTGLESIAQKAAITITELPIPYETMSDQLFKKLPANTVLFDSIYSNGSKKSRLVK